MSNKNSGQFEVLARRSSEFVVICYCYDVTGVKNVNVVVPVGQRYTVENNQVYSYGGDNYVVQSWGNDSGSVVYTSFIATQNLVMYANSVQLYTITFSDGTNSLTKIQSAGQNITVDGLPVWAAASTGYSVKYYVDGVRIYLPTSFTDDTTVTVVKAAILPVYIIFTMISGDTLGDQLNGPDTYSLCGTPDDDGNVTVFDTDSMSSPKCLWKAFAHLPLTNPSNAYRILISCYSGSTFKSFTMKAKAYATEGGGGRPVAILYSELRPNLTTVGTYTGSDVLGQVSIHQTITVSTLEAAFTSELHGGRQGVVFPVVNPLPVRSSGSPDYRELIGVGVGLQAGGYLKFTVDV